MAFAVVGRGHFCTQYIVIKAATNLKNKHGAHSSGSQSSSVSKSVSAALKLAFDDVIMTPPQNMFSLRRYHFQIDAMAVLYNER